MKESDIDRFEKNLEALYFKNKISAGQYFILETEAMYYRLLIKFVRCLKENGEKNEKKI